MSFGVDLPDALRQLSAGEIAAAVLVVLVVVYFRRAGIVLSRLGIENRNLRRGIRGYEHMERQHREVTQENRERNEFHGALPMLISALHEEKTTSGIGRQLVDFAARSLGASQAALFVADGGSLVLRDAKGVAVPPFRVAFGEGRIGAVAEFRRVMSAEDFQNLDPKSRAEIARTPSRIDTAVAAPLLAHGRVIGVLNVGGTVAATPPVRKEFIGLVARLGATSLENQMNFEQLEREATTDGLTGLSNVRSFKDKFRHELARAARFGRSLSVFLFDIDNFKHYNDRNGHPAGDQCLRITGEVLRSSTRITDLPARYGGEEFIVLLPETDGAGAASFAEKIRATIAATEYPAREHQPLGCVSISGGVASFPEDGKDVDALIAAADRALYRCKRAGRNRVARAGESEPCGDGKEPAPARTAP